MGFFGNLFFQEGLGKAIDPFGLTPLGKDAKERPILPDAPTLMTGGEARQTALDFGQENVPLALGARESALQDLLNPQATQDFFAGFQPTSFEQALADQTFKNIFPDVQRGIKHNLSLSGIESSPVLAEQIGQAQGNLGVSIGQILANLGQQRGAASLNARLGIDPISQIINPISTQELNQSNAQDELNFQRELAKFGIDLQRQQQQQADASGQAATIGSLLGAGGGFLVGGPTGAAIGGSLGGSLGGGFGGNGTAASPLSLGDALSLAQVFGGNPSTSTLGGGSPTSVFSQANPSQYQQIQFPELNFQQNQFPAFT